MLCCLRSHPSRSFLIGLALIGLFAFGETAAGRRPYGTRLSDFEMARRLGGQCNNTGWRNNSCDQLKCVGTPSCAATIIQNNMVCYMLFLNNFPRCFGTSPNNNCVETSGAPCGDIYMGAVPQGGACGPLDCPTRQGNCGVFRWSVTIGGCPVGS